MNLITGLQFIHSKRIFEITEIWKSANGKTITFREGKSISKKVDGENVKTFELFGKDIIRSEEQVAESGAQFYSISNTPILEAMEEAGKERLARKQAATETNSVSEIQNPMQNLDALNRS